MKAASQVYDSDPASLQLRMMNMTYESVAVVYLMVVLPHKPRVFILPYRKGMIYVHLWGVVRMDVTPDQLKALGDFQAKLLEGLFHYNSKWVLSEERFKNYWAKGIIQQTNCTQTLRKEIGKIPLCQRIWKHWPRPDPACLQLMPHLWGINCRHAWNGPSLCIAWPALSLLLKKAGV